MTFRLTPRDKAARGSRQTYIRRQQELQQQCEAPGQTQAKRSNISVNSVLINYSVLVSAFFSFSFVLVFLNF